MHCQKKYFSLKGFKFMAAIQGVHNSLKFPKYLNFAQMWWNQCSDLHCFFCRGSGSRSRQNLNSDPDHESRSGSRLLKKKIKDRNIDSSIVHLDPAGSEIICKLGSGSLINSGSYSGFGSGFGSGFESGSKLSSASN